MRRAATAAAPTTARKRFEAKVARLIAQATDEKLLRRMPAAWQAWL